MILDWVVSIPSMIIAAGIVLLPGAVLLRGLLGLRGLALLALAPVASVAMVAVGALGLGIVHAPWSPISLAAVLLMMSAGGWLLGRLLGRPTGRRGAPSHRWVLPAALAVGMTLGAWRLIAYIHDPAGISQTNDSVFHMNAIRYILDTADASSLHVSSVIGGTGFYPAAWHAVVSMTVMLSGADIAVAANASTLVIGAVIWPLGIAWMTRVVTGSTRISAFAAILSSALQAFPLLMFQWGVLFPNALSVALLPAAVAAVMMLPSWIDSSSRVAAIVRAVVMIGIVAAALSLSQPAALPIWALIAVIWFSDRMLRTATPVVSMRTTITLVSTAWLGLGVGWFMLAQGTGGSHWPPFRGKFEVLIDIFLNSHLRMPSAWMISVLMCLGLIAAIMHRSWRWFAVVWAALSALYALDAAVGMPLMRNIVLGPWYADPYRLAALVPIAVIPLAAIGLDLLVRTVATRLPRPTVRDAFTMGTGLAVATVGVILIALLRPVPMPAFLQGTFDRDSRYLTTADSYLSTDERDLLESLDRYVSPGSRIIANPSTGAGFGYMLSGLDVYPRTWTPPSSPAWTVVAGSLRDAAEDPAVCPAVGELGDPAYVLDFGEGESGPGRFVMPGMTHFEGMAGFEPVARRGTVSLWRITACAH